MDFSEYTDDEELIREFGKVYERIMKSRKNEDYEINEPQFLKFVETYAFFTRICKDCDGKLDPIKLVPKEEHGWISATFFVLDMYGENIKRFCDAMANTSAIGFDALTTGEVCFSATIPNIFKHK